MGRDQFGETYHDLGKYPRKTLLARLGRRSARKMYVDCLSEPYTRHVGYVIADRWITLYQVTPWEQEA